VLYVQPVYIVSVTNGIPELSRVKSPPAKPGAYYC